MTLQPPIPAIGLECKAHWCQRLITGEKAIELRAYALPEEVIGRRVWLLATGGPEGVAALGDTAEAGTPLAQIVGWVTFARCRRYASHEQWAADARLHCVADGTPYSWQQGQAQELFGWVVGSWATLRQPRAMPSATRMLRSLYELEADDAELLCEEAA